MPIFEYECKSCGKIFEEFVDDRNIQEVPCKCGNIAKKIISGSNWHINGSCYNYLSPKEEKKYKEGYIYKDGYYVKDTSIDKKILYSLYCKTCDYTIEELYKYDEEIIHKCPNCKTVLNKETLVGSFELKYDPKKDIVDWDGNTSQYWNAVKEERRKGKNVKAINES